MGNTYKKYFLGANSCEGFVSHFGDCFSATEGWHTYIIKGGPGTGKSSLMKYVASRAEKAGYDVLLGICSSDPQSLDAVIIEELKTVILDGTAPHIVEPIYPGACEEIVNLGACWDKKKLRASADKIMAVTRRNKALHKTASGYLAACGELIYDNLRLADNCTDKKKVLEFAGKLCKKYIPKKSDKKGEAGKEWVRFIGGTTPLGIVVYSKTLTDFCDNKIIIDDKYGSVARIITDTARRYALDMGYEVITLKNPFLPSEICDHIIIPELSLVIATENEYVKLDDDSRRIHARRFRDTLKMRQLRGRMLFNRKITRELLLSAAETLAKAKAVHDELEEYYVDAMDFTATALIAEKIADEILLKD